MRHSCGQLAEHVRDGNPHPSNSRPPSTLAGFNGDDVLVVHR
jgi:hypothetical protein